MRISKTWNIYAGKTNYIFLLIAVLLSAIGIFFINDFTSESYLVLHSYAMRQMVSLLLGLACALMISGIDYHLCSVLALPFLGVFSLLSFLGTHQIFPGVFRMEEYGYLEIVDIGISINLFDLALLAVCLVITLIVYKSENLNIMTFLLVGVFYWSYFFFDAKIALIVLLIAITMIFLKKPLTAALYSLALLAAAVFSYVMIYYSDFFEILGVKSREHMDMWLNPADYNWNTGYAIGQSVYDIACGGVFGMGIGAGRAEADLSGEMLNTYILSGIIREIGWFGIIFILMIYFMFFWETVRIVYRTADKFGFYLAAVINMKFIAELIINMFISVNILPYARNGPPFIGYGGSRLLIDFILVGIMLNISRQSTAVSRG